MSEQIFEQTEKATETETPEQATVGNPTVEPEPAEDPATASNDAEDPNETFPREYVEELREESKRYRLRAKQADDLAARLHRELVTRDGRLQDPTDLPYDDAHLEDPEALSAAIGDLLERKPHLKARRVAGDVGAGARGSSDPENVDLIGIMRGMI